MTAQVKHIYPTLESTSELPVESRIFRLACGVISKSLRDRRFTNRGERIMQSVECPHCKRLFGVSMEFTVMAEDTNFKYTCPYCKTECNIDTR